VPPKHENIIVRVPASSANLGPGFDCLGLAVNLYLQVSCTTDAITLRIESSDPDVSTGPDNLIYRALARVFEASGQAVPPVHLSIANGIPLSRGLGSSAAAIAAGLMLGNTLAGDAADKHGLLRLGLPLEGHPDNLAPALFGGLRVSSVVGEDVVSLPFALARAPRIVLFIPDFVMSTFEARRVLPESIPRADAVFNTCRTSLLLAALAAGDFPALRWAMEDRLHQPYRSAIFPALPSLIQAALAAGAAGAALSGAGSTVIAFCDGETDRIAAAFEHVGVPGHSAVTEIDLEGAVFLQSGE